MTEPSPGPSDRRSTPVVPRLIVGGALGGLVAGLLDGAQAGLRAHLSPGRLLAAMALAGAIATLCGLALGLGAGATAALARWGRAARTHVAVTVVGWLLAGALPALAAAALVAATATRNNRFLAALLVVLAGLGAGIFAALVAPAFMRLLALGGQPARDQTDARPLGLLIVAPVFVAALAAFAFAHVAETHAPLRGVLRTRILLAAGAAFLPLPVALALAARLGPRRGWLASWTRLPPIAALLVIGGLVAFVAQHFTEHFQFLPWRDLRTLGLIAAASVIAAILLRRRWPRRRHVPLLLVLLTPWLAVGAALLAARSEPARKATASDAGLVASALALVRPLADRDGDNYPGLLGGGDCNDRDRAVNPAALDWPGDGIDQDCDGQDLTLARLEALRAAPLHPVPASVPRDLNLILIVIDTLRADHLGAYGYARKTSPHIDRLAAEGTLFVNGWAHSPSTRYSLPAIVTGRWPPVINWDHSIFWPRIAPTERTIAEALKDAGYFSGAFYSYSYFEPSAARGFERGVDVYDARRAALHTIVGGHAKSVGSSAAEIASDGISFLETHQGKKFFLGLHFFDPHLDYQRHPGVPDFGGGQGDLYDGEVYFTDQQIGRVIDRVRALGLYDKTAIVITGDHGESLGERGIVAHGYELFAPQTRVPFVVRVPGTAPRRVTAPVSHVDLAPTLLNLARGKPERGFLGRSMLDLITGGPSAAPPPTTVFQWVSFEPTMPGTASTERRGIATATHHLVWNSVPENTTYCFRSDETAEEHDVLGTPAGEPACSELKRALTEWSAAVNLPPGFSDKLAAGVSAPGARAPLASHPAKATLGEVVAYLGHDLEVTGRAGNQAPAVAVPGAAPDARPSPPRIARGGQVTITPHFEVLRPLGPDGWRYFVHLEGPTGNLVLDHTPVEGAYPVERWQVGQRIRDRFTIALGPDKPAGEYTYYVGFWRKPAARLPVSPRDMQDGADRLRVARFIVE